MGGETLGKLTLCRWLKDRQWGCNYHQIHHNNFETEDNLGQYTHKLKKKQGCILTQNLEKFSHHLLLLKIENKIFPLILTAKY